MASFPSPETEYITIPIRKPSLERGQSVKYGYKIYGKHFLKTQTPLILLPGWSGTMMDWLDMPHLISQSRAVITVDHRGIGFSELIFNEHITTHYKSEYAIKHKLNRPIPSFDFDDTVNDVYYLIRHLFKNTILPKMDVLGWSMGGMIAQRFACTYPQVINNLILFGTTMSGKISEQFKTKERDEWIQRSTIGTTQTKNRNDLVQHLMENTKYQFGDSLKAENRQKVISKLVKDVILKSKRPFKTIIAQRNAMQKLYDANGTDLKKLDEFTKIWKINVVIIHGDGDKILGVGNAYHLNKQLKNSKLRILKGEGHWIHATPSGLKQCAEIINNMQSELKQVFAKL